MLISWVYACVHVYLYEYVTLYYYPLQVCQGKGYICEICDVSEIIFPFDGGVVVCAGCSTVLHHLCFTSRNSLCPRCVRQEARKKTETDKEKGTGD